MNAQTAWNFLKLTRPLFLLGGVILYAFGVVTALLEGSPLNLTRLLIGQALITSVQLMTHYGNEFYDLTTDRLNQQRTWFSGGSGILSSGILPPETAQRAAYLFGGLGLVTLAVGSTHVPSLVVIGIASLAAAWLYSAPPLRLVSSGWGELSASLVVALLVPSVGYLLQSGRFPSTHLLLACLPLVLIHFAMLVAFQIPDQLADEAGGKRTLCVRMGLLRTVQIHNLSLILGFCAILILARLGWPGARMALFTLPLAAWQIFSIRSICSSEKPRYTALTMGALALFALTSTAWLAGLLLQLQ